MRIFALMRAKWEELSRVNFRELSFENIAVWPSLLKAMVFVVVFILVFAIGHFLFSSSQYESIEAKKLQEVELKSKVRVNHQILLNLKKDTLQIKGLRMKFDALRANFAKSGEAPVILETISKFGAANHLKFNLLKPLPEKTEAFYVSLPVEIMVEGTYSQLASFMSQVANYERFIGFTRFKLAPSISSAGKNKKEADLLNASNETLRLELIVSIYYYLDEKNPYEHPPEKTSKKSKGKSAAKK